MPNHITNILLIEADKEDDFFSKILNKENDFDFNKIILTPPHIFQGNLGPEEERIYGENTWYTWNVRNWGTNGMPMIV